MTTCILNSSVIKRSQAAASPVPATDSRELQSGQGKGAFFHSSLLETRIRGGGGTAGQYSLQVSLMGHCDRICLLRMAVALVVTKSCPAPLVCQDTTLFFPAMPWCLDKKYGRLPSETRVRLGCFPLPCSWLGSHILVPIPG